MRLLVITQIVDKKDPVLGFFHRWIEEFSKFADLEVVCLKEGAHDLPANVRVHSLGKESGASRLTYVWRFYSYVWNLRRDYDAVFVHMNQEYVLLGSVIWKMLGKSIYMWRNHYAGSWLTDVAMFFAAKIFCTSKDSYTAKSTKTVLMPVGVDTDKFRPVSPEQRIPGSILFFSRFSPSKRPDVFVEALGELTKLGVAYSATVCGSPQKADQAFYESVVARTRELGIQNSVRFMDGIVHDVAPVLYSSHEVYVNVSASGMYDKTIFEAAACGCLVLAASRDYTAAVGSELGFDGSAGGLAARLRTLLEAHENARATHRENLRTLVQQNSLARLGERLREELT